MGLRANDYVRWRVPGAKDSSVKKYADALTLLGKRKADGGAGLTKVDLSECTTELGRTSKKGRIWEPLRLAPANLFTSLPPSCPSAHHWLTMFPLCCPIQDKFTGKHILSNGGILSIGGILSNGVDGNLLIGIKTAIVAMDAAAAGSGRVSIYWWVCVRV